MHSIFEHTNVLAGRYAEFHVLLNLRAERISLITGELVCVCTKDQKIECKCQGESLHSRILVRLGW